MKKLLAIVASALTLGAFASAADPVITADTSAVPSGTTCTVMAGDEEVYDITSNGGDVTMELDDVYVGKSVYLAANGEAITDSTTAQMGPANVKLGALKLAGEGEDLGAKYSYAFAGDMSASTILGGTALVATRDTGSASSYVTVRGSESVNAVQIMAGSWNPYYDSAITEVNGEGATWSIFVSAKISNTDNGILWSLGRKANGGVALVQHTEKIALVKWTSTSNTELISADVNSRQFHNFTVVSTGSKLQLWVDTTKVGEVDAVTLNTNGWQLGGIHGGSDGTGLVKGSGAQLDEFGFWDSALSAEAIAELAEAFPVYPQIRYVYTTAAEEANWDTLGQFSYTLEDGTATTDVSLNDTIVITSDAILGVHKSFEGLKLQIGDATHNATVRFAQAGETDRQDVTLANATITVASGSKVLLNQAWKNGWKKNAEPTLSNTTIEGAGLVEIAEGMTLALTDGSTITAKLTGSGTTDAFSGMTLDSTWSGTVKVATVASANWLDLASYGTANSTIELAGINGGYIAKSNNVTATLKLTGDVNFTDGSSSSNPEFAKLDGTGNFSVTRNTNYTFHKIASTYTGTITNGNGSTIKIEVVETALTELPSVKTKVLSISGTINTTDLTVKLADGTAIDAEKISVESDGIYILAPAVPGADLIPEGSVDDYLTWAGVNGVTSETTTEPTTLAIAFHLDANKGDTYDTIEDAAQAKVEELVAKIDCSKLAGEDGLNAALETLNAELEENGLVASLDPVELEGASESTKLYKLVITLKAQN